MVQKIDSLGKFPDSIEETYDGKDNIFEGNIFLNTPDFNTAIISGYGKRTSHIYLLEEYFGYSCFNRTKMFFKS